MPDATGEARIAAKQADKLAMDQLCLALRNLKPNHLLMPVFAAIICAMFRQWVSTPVLIGWWIAVAVGGLPLGIVAKRLLGRDSSAMRSGRWLPIAAVAYSFFAIVWASQGFLFWRHGDAMNHMLILLILGCTLSGNSALVGSSRWLTTVGYTIYGFTMVALPLHEGGAEYDGLAILAILYVGYLAFMSRQIFATARDMFLLRDDKNALIAALAKSKAASDEALARAETASRAKSQFLANMSHELRTPLNAVLGFSEMIYTRAFDVGTDRHSEYARIIHTSGHHLLELINDILDLAKIEAGGLRLRESEFDLNALIADCVRLMSVKAEDGNLHLRADTDSGLPPVYADERALKQVLLNLLSNALKFTPVGGRVIAFSRREQDGSLAFGVTDTGLGIADEDQSHVFQNFGQGRHDVVTADKGTGLGLPIVKGLIDAHGGRVVLASTVGEGTTVTVVLPSCRARAVPAFQAAS
jgi:two-component system, cell cycle sensor histidine kinase PleC